MIDRARLKARVRAAARARAWARWKLRRVAGPPPGFYDDPDDASIAARYWDGLEWTGLYQPARPPVTAADADSSVHPDVRDGATSRLTAGEAIAVDAAAITGDPHDGVVSGVTTILFGVLLIAGAMFGYSVLAGSSQTVSSMQNPVSTTGTVTSVGQAEYINGGTADAGKITNACKVTYLFTLDGVGYTGESVGSMAMFCDLREGARIGVAYDEKEPWRNAPVGPDAGFATALLLLLVLAPVGLVLRGVWVLVIYGTLLGEGVERVARIRARAWARHRGRARAKARALNATR